MTMQFGTNLFRMTLRKAVAGSAIICATFLSTGAIAQSVELDGVGTAEIQGTKWYWIGSNEMMDAFMTDDIFLDVREETGVYLLYVWHDGATIAGGVVGSISAYGYYCDEGTVVEFSPTNLDFDIKKIPRTGGSPPAIVRQPDIQIERNMLSVACGTATANRTTTDPFNFER